MKKVITNVVGIVALILLIAMLLALFSSRNGALQPASKTNSEQIALQSPLQSPLPTPSHEVTPTEAALEYVRQFLPSKSGQPQILLTRSIRFKDYPELGLGKFTPAAGSDPPLELVLLKGNFDTSNYGVTQKVPFKQASYVVIVYDLEHKAITNVTVSVNGDELKNLLKMAGVKPENK
jgi:hypothetical protein